MNKNTVTKTLEIVSDNGVVSTTPMNANYFKRKSTQKELIEIFTNFLNNKDQIKLTLTKCPQIEQSRRADEKRERQRKKENSVVFTDKPGLSHKQKMSLGKKIDKKINHIRS